MIEIIHSLSLWYVTINYILYNYYILNMDFLIGVGTMRAPGAHVF